MAFELSGAGVWQRSIGVATKLSVNIHVADAPTCLTSARSEIQRLDIRALIGRAAAIECRKLLVERVDNCRAMCS